jgi:DNA-binding transcriptional ArsR family regulator
LESAIGVKPSYVWLRLRDSNDRRRCDLRWSQRASSNRTVDKPVTKASRKIDRPLFSGNRTQVLHALLLHPEQWVSTNELATLAFVSPSTVSVLLGELEKRDLVTAQGKGPNKTRKLARPGVLLDEWARHLSLLPKPTIRRFYVPLVKPEELMKRIYDVCKRNQTAYVITHEWAAQLYSPFLSNISQVKCRIFPNAPLSLITKELNAREVEEGSNWGLIESESIRDMLFAQDIRGLRVESPILAYLDLLDGEGRSREMAEHLRHERIGF